MIWDNNKKRIEELEAEVEGLKKREKEVKEAWVKDIENLQGVLTEIIDNHNQLVGYTNVLYTERVDAMAKGLFSGDGEK